MPIGDALEALHRMVLAYAAYLPNSSPSDYHPFASMRVTVVPS